MEQEEIECGRVAHERRDMLLAGIKHIIARTIPWYTRCIGLFLLLFLVACGTDENGDSIKLEKPVLTTSLPADGSENVNVGEQQLLLIFDQNIVLGNKDAVRLNDKEVVTASAAFKELKVTVILEEATEYTLVIPAGKVKGPTGVAADEINIRFTTRGSAGSTVKTTLVTADPLPETQRVYDFLRENYGKKIVSGTMANVAWNTNEAEWVHQHTGKYPALNCFDYIHLYASPANWINYEDTEVVERWWGNNGLVAAMWHWNVPAAPGSDNYAFYTDGTSFDVSKAVQEGTYENDIVKADLEKMANNLLLLKEKNIPVIWRPLHEAAGGWFWWGAKGAAPCKELWKLMFETFREKGLNNLIWVWTSETGDHDWYPGDGYVDIIGRDAYNKSTGKLREEYEWLVQIYPDKMIALSEFGSVADISEQWTQGVIWSWFMPWYDHERTVNTSGSAFEEATHQHANAAYWQKAVTMEAVIMRDEMPDLK